ncbi:MAG: NAD(P)/FAD-dependent oxidoreductase, partial [Thermoanaerobaculia bacterium]|nr:NAD(P)/FAD-dependent oxidoreductase [Thermoanaerobaculia bacterium]
ADQYDWFYRPGVAAGIIPTNDGQACVWSGTSADRFMGGLHRDLERSFDLLLAEAAPQAVDRVRAAPRASRLRGFRGVPGFLRQPAGPGWALIGDASHFKDPISAHGMTDALRDADFLAEAVDAVLGGSSGEREALAGYRQVRDRLTLDLFDAADEVAAYGWDLGHLRGLLLTLSKAMKEEVEALAELDERPASAA